MHNQQPVEGDFLLEQCIWHIPGAQLYMDMDYHIEDIACIEGYIGNIALIQA